jgi:Spy/CpxP family protein refolding chaperone
VRAGKVIAGAVSSKQQEDEMKKIVLFSAIVAMLILTALPAAAQYRGGYGPGYGYGMMGPGMMGPGYGYMWGPGGMMGPGYQGYSRMTPQQYQAWAKMRNAFMRKTLKLRQQLYAKQLELQTLWSHNNPDQNKVRALTAEVSQLRSKLARMYDQYLLQCRQQFGNQGWSCPGGGGYGPGMMY